MKKLKLVYMKAKDIKVNPNNWRSHPIKQCNDIKNILNDESIGWAGALLYNAKTERLIDGHARLSVVGNEEEVPVIIGEWDEKAEKSILATFDTIGGMAEQDLDMLSSLISEIDLDLNLTKELEHIMKDYEQEKLEDNIEDVTSAVKTKTEPYTWFLIGCKVSNYGKIYHLIAQLEQLSDVVAKRSDR